MVKRCLVGIVIVFLITAQLAAATSPDRIQLWGEHSWYLAGANFPWLNYGHDFGKAWSPDGVSTSNSTSRIEAAFADMKNHGVHVVRWFLLCDGRASPEFNSSGMVVGYDAYFYADLNKAIEIATKNDIYLIPVLWDYLLAKPAEMNNGVQLFGRSRVITDPQIRQSFLDNALKPLLKKYGQSRTIIAWDIMNEPEGAMDIPGGNWVGNPVSIDAMQGFVGDVADYIHTYTTQYATVGSASRRWLSFWTGSNLDFYQYHYYDYMEPEYPLDYPAADLNLDKPVIVGEFPTAGTSRSLSEYLDTIWGNGYAGALAWSYLSVDGFSNFPGDNFLDWSGSHSDAVNIRRPTPTLSVPEDGLVINDATPTFTWNAVSGVSKYKIQVDDNADFSSPVFNASPTGTSSTSTVVLSSEVTYYWHVQAYDFDGAWSDWSDARSFTVDAFGPPAPALLLPLNGITVNTGLMSFDWSDGGADVQYYQLQVDDLSSFAGPELAVETTAPTYHTITALNDGLYYWRVRAYDALGNAGPWSLVQTVKVDTLNPAPPVLSAPANWVNTTDTTPTLKWKAPAGATQYKLQVDDSPAFDSPIEVGPVSTPSYTPGTPLDYGLYYWRVQAGDVADNWSGWSMARRFTVTLLKSPVNAVFSTNPRPVFSWNKVGGASAYEFQLDDSSDLGSPLILPTSTGISTSFTPLASLAHGEYFWTVRAQVGGVWSAWMPAWSLTVTTPPPPKPILRLPSNGAVLDTLTPSFTWDAVSEGSLYQIQIDSVNTFSHPDWDMTYPYSALPVMGTLSDSGKYYWRVRALNGTGVAGSWSTVGSFTLSQLSAPILLTPPNKTPLVDTTPGFTWGSVINASSYQIQIGVNANFLTITHSGVSPSTGYTVPGESELSGGVYTWRVRAVDVSGVPGKWSAPWTFTVDTTGPAAPVLSSPVSEAGTADTPPTFAWKAPKDGKSYRIQVTTGGDADFNDLPLVVDQSGIPSVTYTPATALGYGFYLWRVQALDALGNPGDFSPAAPFAVTLHTAPKDGSSTTSTQPTFQWAAVTGATWYQFQLAHDSSFASLAWEYAGTARTTKPSTPLAVGTYSWRVCVTVGGVTSDWMPTWTVIITPPLPAKPVLLAPANKALINDNVPSLSWRAVLNGAAYEVQIDNNKDFSSPEQDVTLGSGLLNYVASVLDDGTYVWRVRAINSLGAPGAWSSVWSLTIDTTLPDAPLLIAPVGGTSITNTRLVLSWNKVPGAVRYDLHLDTNPSFPLPVIDAGNTATYRPPTPLSRGTYSWQVRAVDAAGNVSGWSDIRSFDLVAGITAQDTATPMPTLVPTLEPTVTPLPTETPLPPVVNPPVEGLYMVESEDPAVIQTGNWTAHETPYASGGRYLYSSGSPDDTLSLTFSGSRLDVIYVKHPALGVFVIEIDGIPMQLVDSTAPDSEFGARTTVSLGAGSHTLRVYPMTGTLALDAFAVETQTLPQPTVEPTGATLEPPINPTETVLPPVEPTAEPTSAPTLDPTAEATLPPVEPTAEPPLPPVPTNTPLPGVLPFADSFDSDQGWNAAGAWRLDTGYSGLAWFADSTPRGQVSTLTYGTLIDLRGAAYPQVSFWQKAVLIGGESLAVEVSLDGGLSWLVVDEQTGPISDWVLHTVDLGAYRGSIIGLRFTLSAFSPVPEGVSTVGCWLDDLAIQDAPPMPTATPLPTEVPTATPLPTETPTEIPTATETPTEVPTIMPVPTDVPTATPLPTEIPLEIPTDTPPVVETPAS